MKWLWVFLALVIVLPFFHIEGLRLHELTEGILPDGVALKFPTQRLLIEPFAGAVEYFYFLKESRQQVIILFFLSSVFLAIRAYWLDRQLRRSFYILLISWLGFITLIAILIIAPIPTVRLSAPADWITVDVHSHTWLSYDGLASPGRNLRYHKGLGFDCFFITDHDAVAGCSSFTEEERRHSAFPGIEMHSTDGFSFLILATRQFSASEFTAKNAAQLIEAAHREGFQVICPHGLLRQRWQLYQSLDIDGFDVFDSADHDFYPDERANLMRYCRERNLLMVGASDYHGWCSVGNVWTLVRNPARSAASPNLLLTCMRDRNEIRIVITRWPEEYFGVKSIFIPIARMIRYFGSMNHLQSASWACYTLSLIGMYKWLGWRNLLHCTAVFLCLFFLLYAAYLAYCWYFILQGSDSIVGKCIPAMAVLAGAWLIVMRLTSSYGSFR